MVTSASMVMTVVVGMVVAKAMVVHRRHVSRTAGVMRTCQTDPGAEGVPPPDPVSSDIRSRIPLQVQVLLSRGKAGGQ